MFLSWSPLNILAQQYFQALFLLNKFQQQVIEYRLNEVASNATVSRELSALKRMLNLGAQQTPPIVDRVPHISMLEENNVRKGFFEHDEFLALRNALPLYLKGFATFAYKSGWRVSEKSVEHNFGYSH